MSDNFTPEELAERIDFIEGAVVHHNPRRYDELHRTSSYVQAVARKGTGYLRIYIQGTFLVRKTYNIVSASLGDMVTVNNIRPEFLEIEWEGELVHLLLTKDLPQAVYFFVVDTNAGAIPRIQY